MRRKPMPAATRPLVGSCLKDGGKAGLRLVEVVGVEGRKGGSLGRGAGDAGVHLRQLGLILLEEIAHLDVLWDGT